MSSWDEDEPLERERLNDDDDDEEAPTISASSQSSLSRSDDGNRRSRTHRTRSAPILDDISHPILSSASVDERLLDALVESPLQSADILRRLKDTPTAAAATAAASSPRRSHRSHRGSHIALLSAASDYERRKLRPSIGRWRQKADKRALSFTRRIEHSVTRDENNNDVGENDAYGNGVKATSSLPSSTTTKNRLIELEYEIKTLQSELKEERAKNTRWESLNAALGKTNAKIGESLEAEKKESRELEARLEKSEEEASSLRTEVDSLSVELEKERKEAKKQHKEWKKKEKQWEKEKATLMAEKSAAETRSGEKENETQEWKQKHKAVSWKATSLEEELNFQRQSAVS